MSSKTAQTGHFEHDDESRDKEEFKGHNGDAGVMGLLRDEPVKQRPEDCRHFGAKRHEPKELTLFFRRRFARHEAPRGRLRPPENQPCA